MPKIYEECACLESVRLGETDFFAGQNAVYLFPAAQPPFINARSAFIG